MLSWLIFFYILRWVKGIFCGFEQNITAVPKQKRDRAFGFLDTFGLGTTLSHPENLMEVKVSEVDSAASTDICNIQIRSDGEFFASWPNFSLCVIHSEKNHVMFWYLTMILNWLPQNQRPKLETGWDLQSKWLSQVLGKNLALVIVFIGHLARKLIKNVK